MNAEKLFDMLPYFGEMIEKLDLEEVMKKAQTEKDRYQAGFGMINIQGNHSR